ncbi:MAG: phosphoribosylaminoimidazolesuccinocarboxamide synthase [Rhodothermaceae bacterium]|nr:phosphoribosylaminoimidazolesuccinocarboxamide synthase [Rhodothermaceae bacterium]
MDRDTIKDYLPYTLRETHYKTSGTFYRGKVRDTYLIEDKLILIASDRISAFDHILNQSIPFKGQVLNKIAAYFFDSTSDIVNNHVLSVPDPNVTVAKACKALPIEFVVRGYLAGHAWRVYKQGIRVLCGETLPEGLRQNSKLPAPILTPATKAQEGHDEDISKVEILERGIIDKDTLDLASEKALELFQRGSEMAQEKGLILVDTKYEFGIDHEGSITLIDEIHTPDSSRYFYSDTYQDLYEQNLPQRQLSKEFVREWLMDNNFQGLENQVLPDLPDSFVQEISMRYIELYEKLTGTLFVPDLSKNPIGRIEKVVQPHL